MSGILERFLGLNQFVSIDTAPALDQAVAEAKAAITQTVKARVASYERQIIEAHKRSDHEAAEVDRDAAARKRQLVVKFVERARSMLVPQLERTNIDHPELSDSLAALLASEVATLGPSGAIPKAALIVQHHYVDAIIKTNPGVLAALVPAPERVLQATSQLVKAADSALALRRALEDLQLEIRAAAHGRTGEPDADALERWDVIKQLDNEALREFDEARAAARRGVATPPARTEGSANRGGSLPYHHSQIQEQPTVLTFDRASGRLVDSTGRPVNSR